MMREYHVRFRERLEGKFLRPTRLPSPAPGQICNRPSKSIRENFNMFIKLCGNRTVHSTRTESIGLAANARGVMVFAIPS